MKIEASRRHDGDVAAVIDRINSRFEMELKKYESHVSNLESKWVGNTLHVDARAYGADCSVITRVEADRVEVEAEFPWGLIPFKSKLSHMIEFRLGKVCG